MTRLKKGALIGRITASILASTLFVSSALPVMAADTSSSGNEVPVKTLAPLPDSQAQDNWGTSAGAAPSSDSGLKFTPESAAPAAPSSAPSSPAVASEPAAAAPQPVSATASDATAGADAATESSDNLRKEITPAPPEVTEAQPLNNSSDGKELAQATASRPRTPTDPSFNKLPSNTGSVKIRRGFTYFPSNQIIHNLSFRDTPVKEVIAEIARRGNLNMIIDKSAVGRITGDLHDVTLNEAMDTVMASAGLQARQLDNSTVILGSPNALFNLGLNRPMMRVFKLSYSSAFDVAQILWATAFNRGYLPDFSQAVRNRTINLSHEQPVTKTAEETIRGTTVPTAGGGTQTSKTSNVSTSNIDSSEENEVGEETNMTTRPDNARTLRGSIREQTNEGQGFNSAATDPGSQTLRATVNVVSDYAVDQNGGGAIAIPDVRNRQVIVCGTQDDINIAEEAIRLIDRRPKQVHIQSSLVELSNQGIRQLGAALNLQGAGASSSVLGGAGSPLVNFLPGLGSIGQFTNEFFTNSAGQILSGVINRAVGIPAVPAAFNQSLANGAFRSAGSVGTAGSMGGNTSSLTGNYGQINGALAPVPGPPANGFSGFLGTALPISTPSIAGIQANPQSQTGFNFLTLSKKAGGRANIATVPVGLNLTLNLVLQTNKAKLLANPSVIVEDNTEALITLANEVVHKVTTTVSLGVVSTNVELVKAGIFLDVLPKVGEDGFVTLRLRPQVSSPLGGPQTFAGGSVVVTLLNVREVLTQEVRVKDGQTLVLGGLFSEQEASTLAKVPYLAEAPILGALFRNTIKGRNRTELMLLITPKIVEDQPPNSISEGAGPSTL